MNRKYEITNIAHLQHPWLHRVRACPAGRHMVQSIRLAKAEITKARRKKA
jgi:hypothetical protein